MSTIASKLNATKIVTDWWMDWRSVLMVPEQAKDNLVESIDKAIRIALDQGRLENQPAKYWGRARVETMPKDWPDPRQVETSEVMASAAARIIEMQAVMTSIARMASHYSKED